MLSRSAIRAAVLAAAAVAAASPATLAQWSTDPSANTPIDTDPSGQDLCKVSARADGGCWIAWFTSVPAPEFYNVRIQRLDAAGVAQLGPRGVLVSAHQVGSATFGDWDLQTDSAGNALLVFNDTRAGTAGGTDTEINAYRIAPDGSMLWGPDGVMLTDDTVSNFVCRIAQTTDGNFTVVFDRSNSAATPPRGLLMQRLDGAGNILLAPGGVLIAGSGVGGAGASDGPGFFKMVPADNNSVIVFYGKDTRSFSSPRYPTIQKYDATGAGVWNEGVAITLQANVWPIAYYPNLISDGAGGAVVSWHDTRTGTFNCWVQKLDAAGNQAYPAGGVAVSTNAQLHVDPTEPVLGPNGEVYVFWSERSGSQGMRALYGQKIDAAGVRQWTDDGIGYTPFDTEVETFMRSAPVPCGAGAMVVYKSEPSGSINDTMYALRVDGAGAQVWTPSPVTVSSVASDKGRMPITRLRDGSVVVVWSDSRTAGNDIYAQKVNPDGTLGGPTLCPADFNRSGSVSVQDIFDYLAAYFSGDPCADFNHSGAISVQDIFDYLAAYFTPCI